jgi:lysophospholipase L1-like esterase
VAGAVNTGPAPRAGWLRLLFALACVLCLLAQGLTPALAAPRPVKIVALGDSYTSGNGAGFYYGPEGCYRSRAGWVEQYAAGLRGAGYQVNLINRACSGAETKDILNERVMDSANYTIPLVGDQRNNEAAARHVLTSLGLCVARHPEEERYSITTTSSFNGLLTTFIFTCTRILAPQIAGVTRDTDLVVLIVGGNDVGFATLVRDCFVLPSPAGCRAAVQNANNLMPVVQDRLAGVLKAVGDRLRPAARVGLISYPHLERSDDFTITSLLPPDSYRAGEEVRKLGRRGDEIQIQAVNAANGTLGRPLAHFVGGVKELFAGHEPDGNVLLFNPQGWLHELTSSVPAEWYHLNLSGHAAYSGLMLADPRFGPGAL